MVEMDAKFSGTRSSLGIWRENSSSKKLNIVIIPNESIIPDSMS
jgi:hypothetical protein